MRQYLWLMEKCYKGDGKYCRTPNTMADIPSISKAFNIIGAKSCWKLNFYTQLFATSICLNRVALSRTGHNLPADMRRVILEFFFDDILTMCIESSLHSLIHEYVYVPQSRGL